MTQNISEPQAFTNGERLLAFLKESKFQFQSQEHKPLFTFEEARNVVSLPGIENKSLFLRDRKKRNYYLLVTQADKRVDLAAVGHSIGVGRLGMGSSEDLFELLGVTPGSVSILALFADTDRRVVPIMDTEVWNSNKMLAHPMRNDATLSIDLSEVKRFLALLGYEALLHEIPVMSDCVSGIE